MTMTTTDRDEQLAQIARAAGFKLFPALAEGTHANHALDLLALRLPHLEQLRRFHRVELQEYQTWGGRTLAALAYTVCSEAGAEYSKALIVDCRGAVLRTMTHLDRLGAVGLLSDLIAEANPTAALQAAIHDEIVEREQALAVLYRAHQEARTLNITEQVGGGVGATNP